jgi:NAD(P)-dependent dehydrogenase (short-subunit alcohol dehydrogenase family)
MTLENKISLVTGGSRGLGRDTALRLAENGSDIILTYVNNKNAADEVVSAIEQKGRKAAALSLDVSDSSSFDGFKESLTGILSEKWNSETINFLINNAGTGVHGMVTDTSEEAFDSMVNIHLKGPFFLTQKLLPMISDNGRVVNISTGLARFTFPGYAAYAAAKGAAEIYTKYLAKEVGSRGITANIVAPGAIDNDFNKHAFDAHPEVKDIIASNTALGRVGVSEDIGGVVAFLCSEDARWISGQRIEASGGAFL